MPNPFISLCMIVKNEEHFMEQCLNSVHDFVDEIIIVDTGSTDKTKEICQKFNVNLYSFKWQDHFAEARNFGVSKAKGEWIFWIDADEKVETEKLEMLKERLEKTKADMIFLPVINYYGDTLPVQENQGFIYYQPRLFRNRKGIRFYNRIHETPMFPEKAQKDSIEIIETPIHHYGYIKEVTDRLEKSKRNLRLLQMEMQNPNHSPWIEYHLANELYQLKNYEAALENVNESIFSFLLNGIKPPALLYRLKYAILLEANSLKEAEQGIEKALQLYPDYVDLHFIKGLLLFHRKQYKEALQSFEKCLELGEVHPEYLVTKGFGSDAALHYKTLCLEKIEQLREKAE